MNYEKFDVIEFEKGSYIVLNVIKYNEFTYLYLINSSESEDDVSIVKVVMKGDTPFYENITDDNEFNIVFNLIMEENKVLASELVEN